MLLSRTLNKGGPMVSNSGLIIPHKWLSIIALSLRQNQFGETDEIIQNCLMGKLPACHSCKDRLVISKTLLMYHRGWNVSTYNDRSYQSDAYQCGHRHPFHGWREFTVR